MFSRRPATSAAARVLIEDPQRSDAALAELAQVGSTTITSVRARLEQVGVIPHIPVADRVARPRPRQDSRTAAAIAAGCTTPRQIADAANVSMQAAWRAWRKLNPVQQDVAAATDSISVAKMPRMYEDTAAATDSITVSATATCGQCGQPFSVSTRNSRRRYCTPRCADAAAAAQGHAPKPRLADPDHPFPQIQSLPPPPDWSRGTCAHVPASQQTWWTSSDPVLREAAAHLCSTCPILAECAQFSLALPVTDPAVYAGMSQAERLRRKREERRLAAMERPSPTRRLRALAAGKLRVMALRIIPVTFAQARAFVAAFHRHHAPPAGAVFSLGVADERGVLRGVATVGRPTNRISDDGLTAEVTRACTDGTANACSMLYAASWRAAKALGYTCAITYTQDGESGSSLRAAGWRQVRQSLPRERKGRELRNWSPSPGDDVIKTLWAAGDGLATRNGRVTGHLCGGCASKFIPGRADARYCSPRCRQRAYRRRVRASLTC